MTLPFRLISLNTLRLVLTALFAALPLQAKDANTTSAASAGSAPAEAEEQSSEPAKVSAVEGARAVEKTAAEKGDIKLTQVQPITTRELLHKPKNLARWHMGAVLFSAHDGPVQPFNWRDADDGESAGLLIGDDPSAGLELTPDVYRFVIELNDYFLVDRYTFKNFNAVGSLQVYYANALVRSDSEEWKVLTDPIPFDSEGYISARFDEVDTKHLMVVFDIVETGSIGIFGIYGDMSLAETRIPRTREDAEEVVLESTTPEETTKFNFGSIHGGSRITHINTDDTGSVESIIDDDVETSYQFPPDSKEDVVIVDMTEQQDVNRVSMLFESGPGVFDFYMTNDLPDDMELIEGESAEEAPPAEASTSEVELIDPDSEDMASIWEQEMLAQRPVLLAAQPGGLGELLAIGAMLFAQDLQKVVLPQSFFENNEFAMQFEVDGSEGRFRADFETITTRYLIIRFLPDPNAPPGDGLRIFEIGLFGDVPEEKRRLVRVPVFEFFENSDVPTDGGESIVGGGGNAPIGGGGGGDTPRPPPPVSPL